MTPQQLKNKIKLLKLPARVTTQFITSLASIEMWDYDREAKKYVNQQEHWVGWLSQYSGPGAYGRKGGVNRDAQFSYNHIACPPMLLWLGEASGISKPVLQLAVKDALSANKSFLSQCSAIRRVIPWEDIESKLLSK